MADIKITPDALEGEAVRLQGYIAQHEANMKNIKDLMNNLENQWTGEAQQAFYNQFNAQDRLFNNFVSTLDRFRQIMTLAAQTMRESDEYLQNQIKGL